jgi:hypothetical protein
MLASQSAHELVNWASGGRVCARIPQCSAVALELFGGQRTGAAVNTRIGRLVIADFDDCPRRPALP